MLVDHDLHEFSSTYITLGQLLARIDGLTNGSPLLDATPPGQTSVPESKGGTFVNGFAAKFLESTFYTIVGWIERPQWTDPSNSVFFCLHSRKRVKVYLGKAQQLIAIDDGGVSMAFQRDLSSNESHRVVLSIEAKRKKHATENDETTANRHAAQIFAEMLGQVCHPDLFETLDNNYQEAFVIHIRHTRIYLFYAKFPNSYLSRIAAHGAKYSHLFPAASDRIRLRQSRAYSMNLVDDQARFFADLAKLLWYLSSGKSHVGYLCHCPQNPFAPRLPPIMHDSVVVRELSELDPADSEYYEEIADAQDEEESDLDDEDSDLDDLDERMRDLALES